MTLPFSTKWPDRMGELAKQPNYFVEKILLGLYNMSPRRIIELKKYYQKVPVYSSEFRSFIEAVHYRDILKPKLHTIREDAHGRWKRGMKIHFVINNRTKNRFQFAPVLECVSIQYISICYVDDYPIVYLGETMESVMPFYWENPSNDEDGYGVEQMKQLAINDGFPSIEAFFQYFDSNFNGKIIHWTDLKY